MSDSHDLFNASAQMDAAEIDRINRDFYGRFNYPWLPMVLPQIGDPGFLPRFIAQELGDFSGTRIPSDGRIWVAGCGTNQAVLTALRFPGAQVLGTDVSTRSLEVARNTADQLGLKNLTLEEASLNDPRHEACFDHVICTGVIHHNADPERPLATLARALKPQGVMELMVYNFYHRQHTTAYQKAIRLLSGARGHQGLLESELAMTRDLIADGRLPGSMTGFLAAQRDLPEPAVADSLLQPVEYSYTVQSLAAMCARAGLQILQPCVNQFDKLSGQFSWDPPLPDGPVREAFDALEDLPRWQVANLLMQEASPMLWFYVQRQGPRRSRPEIDAAFLDQRFRPAMTPVRSFVLGADQRYSDSGRASQWPVPALPADPLARAVHAACDGTTPLRTILDRLSPAPDRSPAGVTRLRQMLTTPAFPYLVAA
ncbi:class I SAM-dependent methyltransferase [Gemmobacter serpentinus]|uniref:class I SAM-dependent methyltransferase n=1 Tax=Gemmobacter serpentinus TaxID=2652247 RepID=UPI00124D1800|nr:class I SAM-dependent methyltransferase [Gemmobacter serpentinus]